MVVQCNSDEAIVNVACFQMWEHVKSACGQTWSELHSISKALEWGDRVVSTIGDSSEAMELDLSLKGTNLQIT